VGTRSRATKTQRKERKRKEGRRGGRERGGGGGGPGLVFQMLFVYLRHPSYKPLHLSFPPIRMRPSTPLPVPRIGDLPGDIGIAANAILVIDALSPVCVGMGGKRVFNKSLNRA
jgi:hypothetical protein